MAHTPSFAARGYASSDRSEWLRMRLVLWPQMDAAAQLVDMDVWLARPDSVVLVVPRKHGADAESAGRDGIAIDRDAGAAESGASGALAGLAGFAEVGTRSVAESCESSPVAYLEGWYVDADMRRKGVGAALVRAAEDWARAQGFREFASDTEIANLTSQRAHAALGFVEAERLVVYRKVL